MINPQTISEQLLFATVKISYNGSVGTGFFFHLSIDGKQYPIIITNRHVVQNQTSAEVSFFVHLKENNLVTDQNLNVKFHTDWYSHPNQDLCFCFVKPLLDQVLELAKKEVFYIAITEDLIWDAQKLDSLRAVEDVLMVGYPIGLWDEKNNLPLFRKGITSSHPAVDFNRQKIGAVDMACFPGSSGSPIFIVNEGGYTDKRGTNLGASRIIFLGVLFEGAQLSAEGEIVIKNIPTQQKVSSNTPVMINLGYYIKAEEILLFKEKVKGFISKK